jgi:SulP family sulfate permease
VNAPDLKQFAILAELREEDLEPIAELLEARSASRGVALFREGSEAEGLVLLASGEARLQGKRSSRKLLLQAGDAVGGLSLIVVGPREATAIAEQPCTYWLFRRTSFRRLVEDFPHAACRLMEAVLVDAADALRESLDDAAQGMNDA